MSHLVVVVHDSLMMQLGFRALQLNPQAMTTRLLGTDTAAACLLAFWQQLRPGENVFENEFQIQNCDSFAVSVV